MQFETIPVGATLTRRYYTLQTPATMYTTGIPFDSWDDAVIAAQAAYQQRVTTLAAAATWSTDPAHIQDVARRGVYLETRIVMSWDRDIDPHGVGGSVDMMAERHGEVMNLRTRASFAR